MLSLIDQIKNPRITITCAGYCCIRQGASVDKKISGITGNTHHKCFICIDLMMRLDSIFEEILANVDNGYEFDTFLIGATLPRNSMRKKTT